MSVREETNKSKFQFIFKKQLYSFIITQNTITEKRTSKLLESHVMKKNS